MSASYADHRAQLKAILLGWGMPEDNAEITSEILSWSDLHGVDSHGISMIPGYDRLRKAGRARMDARPSIAQETPVTALVDGGGGLGHVPGHFAMQTAIGKAKSVGMAGVAVRNSAHFGATGYYTLMAAKEGLIGMACTACAGIQVAPTFGKEAKLGTDPWSFAAPTVSGQPFLLDMATTTVAAGRIRNKANEGLPTPDGWVLDKEGQPSNDPEIVAKGGFLTSLGGSPENSSYKGYGLATMVNILGSCLSGATLITERPDGIRTADSNDIGHFFMVINPAVFRPAGDFEADVSLFLDHLRSTAPIDPGQPVMVAGDPQWKLAEERMRDGIPVGAGLLSQLRQIAQAAAAPWLLD